MMEVDGSPLLPMSDETTRRMYGLPGLKSSEDPLVILPLNLDPAARALLQRKYRDPDENGIMQPSIWEETAGVFAPAIAAKRKGRFRIFEGACNDGTGARLLHKLYGDEVEIEAVDINDGVLELARMATEVDPEAKDANIHYGLRSVVRTGFPNNYFDGAKVDFGIYALSGSKDARRTIDEMARIVKPGGTVVISSRDVDHNENLVGIARTLAERFNLPDFYPEYFRCPLRRTGNMMRANPRYKYTRVERRPGSITVPLDDQESRGELRQAALSYWAYLIDPLSGEHLTTAELQEGVDAEIERIAHETSEISNGLVFKDKLRQGFVVSYVRSALGASATKSLAIF